MKTKIHYLMLTLFILAGSTLRAQEFTNFRTSDGLPSDFVTSVAIDASNNKWFGTSSGVARYNDTSFTVYNTANGLPDSYITCIAADQNGNIWAGTNFGLCKFDGTKWTTFTTTSGLIFDGITCIACPSDGSIWIGTLMGLSHLVGTAFTNYTTTQGLPDNMISYVTPDLPGNEWLGTSLAGLAKYNGAAFLTFTKADSLTDTDIRSIAITPHNHKWVGTATGVSHFDSLDQWVENFREIDGLMNNSVKDLAVDSQGVLWIGMYDSYKQDGGLQRFDGTSWKTYTTSDSLVNKQVARIAVDHQANLWIATAGGVSKLTVPHAGINDQAYSFGLYPNPAHGSVYLDLPVKTTGLAIYDLTGTIRMVNHSLTNSGSLDISRLTPGIYFVKVNMNGQSILKKLVIL